ncbi:proton-coupled zinc antiporter SLC30A5 [Octopus bimaculoides]|uniref:Proton-coupled zinc antiporter SLC30A5 n=1 Tax=Octopus bimaculoides TaxID=37653 RepID=A0A0L8FZS9_OCTBM|nr:proton-coupled zinc antiporter SLC30A5 [Octopus bimaculoides]|eukprot:XP_014785525.1 PREDICTED: zinc transporter 5-like [Octopus bimaculoides]
MTEAYNSQVLPSRAIYPSSKNTVYIGLLVVAKFFRAFGLFLSYDLLKVIPVVQFLFIIKAGSSGPFLLLQKPFSSGKKLSKNQWFRVFRHAVIGSMINLLWLFGLTLCGPLRTILLFEHSDIVVIAWASALFSSNGSAPSKLRGALFFLLGVVSLLLLDHDDRLHLISDHESDDLHNNFITRIFHHAFDLIGWSDHKGGVVLLFLTLCLQTGFDNASKKLSIDLGGAKRLHALSTFVSGLLLFPWALFLYISIDNDVQSTLYLLFPIILVVFFTFIVDYYVTAVVNNHLQNAHTAAYGSYAIFIFALLISVSWNHPYMARITTMDKLKEIITEDHILSAGVLFSICAFLISTYILISPSRGSKMSFIGYSPAGMPLYSITGEALHKTSTSILSLLKGGLRHILEESDSRKIFYFLCINMTFTFVELVYGVWTNSLGLISDGFHMMFDCSALVMGLYAAVMTRWKATRIFSFGFDRVEVLSGFVNGLFLIIIALFVFTEAIARLFEPPEIRTERLLTISVLGLLVNLVGIFVFHSHGHGHGHGHGHSHSQKESSSSCGGHGHAHGSSSGSTHHHSPHGHHHHPHHQPTQHGHPHLNTNMQGVFLHVLADTLGSVGVIVSSILIENFGWNVADPICSVFIAALILLSVFPLLKETSYILLQRTPLNQEKPLNECLNRVLALEGVTSYRDPHFWNHTSTKIMGCIHVQVKPDASEQKIIAQVNGIFKDIGVHSLVIQVEKDAYFLHLSGLGATFDPMIQQSRTFGRSNIESITAVPSIASI